MATITELARGQIATPAGADKMRGELLSAHTVRCADSWMAVATVYSDGAAEIEVAAGYNHSLALKFDGSIVQWGNNDSGQLNGKPTDAGYVRVAAGVYHSIALRADGSIVQWGYNVWSQSNGKPTDAGYVQVAAGGYHNLALRADGTIIQWGATSAGQMNGKPTGPGFVQVAAGGYHSLALQADGTIVQWGLSSNNQLNGKPTGAGYARVAAGAYHSLALEADGSIVQWGDSSFYQLNGKPTDAGFSQAVAGAYASLVLRKPSRSWTVTRLHPVGAVESSVNAVDGPKQGGYADYGAGWHATTWAGTNVPNDLGPGVVNGLDGGREYGDIGTFAYSWNGTEASVTPLATIYDLTDSHCSDAADGQQVGWGFDGVASWLSMLWTGPSQPGSLLTNGGFTSVWGVGGGVQVGQTVNPFAVMWRGTLESIVGLHPVGAATSGAYGTDGVQEVGSATFGGVEMAGFWTGSQESWTPLHPNGASSSRALRVSHGMQVGFAVVGGVKRASYWEGSAGSWVDLGASLPAEFAGSESSAKDIFVQGNTVTIVGDAINGLTGQREAVMWVNVAGAVDTSLDNNFDRFGKTLAVGESTLSNTLFFTMSGSAAAGVEDFQYSLDGAPFKHCGKSVYLTSLSLGTHTVELRAVDSNANVDVTPASLNWTVITPIQAIDELKSYVASMSATTSTKTSLLVYLNLARNVLTDTSVSNDSQASSQIKSFRTKVASLLNQGRLTPQQAQYLSDQANKLISALS